MNYDVFISYSSEDQKVVEGLCAYLEQHKIRCFVAYRDIPITAVWAKAIVEALEESRMMIVVFSAYFNTSDQVDREIELASKDKKPILTFRITNDAFKGAKKYYLNNINWIDAFPNPSEVFGTVADSVARLLDLPIPKVEETPKPEPTPEPKPEPAPKPMSGPRPIPVPQPMPAPQPQPAPESNTTRVRSYNIGDYYNENGKEGVVFDIWDEGRHGKIVSLDETILQWFSGFQYIKSVKTGAINYIDGKANTNLILSRNDNTKYPAFYWCRAKGRDWYLPAIYELERLLLNNVVYNAVNRTLKAMGKRVLHGRETGVQKLFLSKVSGHYWYWSSTEDFDPYRVKFVNAASGETSVGRKSINSIVRAVATF